MDTDWTFSSQSWLWEEDVTFKNSCGGSDWSREEDKAFENALAVYYNDADRWEKIASAVPGKTIEEIKLHYEALSDDVAAIESGKVPLPHYPSKVSVRRKRKKCLEASAQRGVPWTEEEHTRFLYGLERFGRGDWKSISRYSVRTKSNSQVASHAQKYFKRLQANEGKRPSINDIRSVNPESLSALEKATTSCMPEDTKGKYTNAGNKKLLLKSPKKASTNDRIQLQPGHCKEASTNAKNRLLSACPKETSTDAGNQLVPVYSNEASSSAENQLLPIYLKEAPTTGNKLLSMASTNAGKQLLPGYPKEASTIAGNQLVKVELYPMEASTNAGKKLFSGYPKEASTCVESQLLPGYPSEASTNAGSQLFKGYPEEASNNVRNQLFPEYPMEASTNAGSQLFPENTKEASTNAGKQQLPGYPEEASADVGNQLLPGCPKQTSTDVGNQLPPHLKEASINVGNKLLLGYPNEVPNNTMNQLFLRYPEEALTNARNQLLPPAPFAGMCVHPFSGNEIAGPGTSAAEVPACSMFTFPFANQPIQEPGSSVGMPAYHPPVASMQDGGITPAGSLNVPSTSFTEIIDLDMIVFPHFLD